MHSNKWPVIKSKVTDKHKRRQTSGGHRKNDKKYFFSGGTQIHKHALAFYSRFIQE